MMFFILILSLTDLISCSSLLSGQTTGRGCRISRNGGGGSSSGSSSSGSSSSSSIGRGIHGVGRID